MSAARGNAPQAGTAPDGCKKQGVLLDKRQNAVYILV